MMAALGSIIIISSIISIIRISIIISITCIVLSNIVIIVVIVIIRNIIIVNIIITIIVIISDFQKTLEEAIIDLQRSRAALVLRYIKKLTSTIKTIRLSSTHDAGRRAWKGSTYRNLFDSVQLIM